MPRPLSHQSLTRKPLQYISPQRAYCLVGEPLKKFTLRNAEKVISEKLNVYARV
jgi:hypothetical protein